MKPVFLLCHCVISTSRLLLATKHFRYPLHVTKASKTNICCSFDSIKLLLYYLMALFCFNLVCFFASAVGPACLCALVSGWGDVKQSSEPMCGQTVMFNPHYVCGGGRHEEKTAIKHRGVYFIPLIKTTKAERVSLLLVPTVMVKWSHSAQTRPPKEYKWWNSDA